jgi:hypothetical protein
MDLTIELLDGIERECATAPASLVQLRMAQVQASLACASPDVRDYAGALLLKLEHLARQQSVDEGGRVEAPTYLAPWMGIGEFERAAA